MSETFSFATDIHGNMHAVDRFLHVSKQEKIDHVVFGGDIAPKRMAVALADGRGVTVNMHEARLEERSAHALEETGHILFPATLTSEEFEKGSSLATFLSDPRNVKNLMARQLTEEELKIVRRVLLPALLSFLSERDGSELLRRQKIRAATTGMPWARVITAQDICAALDMECVLSNLGQRDMLGNKAEKKAAIVGDAAASDQALKEKIENTLRIWHINIESLIAECMRIHMPWHQWQRQAQQLDAHALKGQEKFLSHLMEKLREFRNSFRGSISLILGNDDHKELIQMLDDAQQQNILLHATNRVVDLNANTQMLGYTNVPPLHAMYDAWFSPEEIISVDLHRLQESIRGNALVIANIHCPPTQSILSLGKTGDGATDDFGSRGVRNYVDSSQPNIVLTGHIHEPYTLNGDRHVEHSGRTVMINPGASEHTPRIAIGSLEKPEETILLS